MNRQQARAILANLDLIRHFAEGGDIGHQAKNWAGEEMPIYYARGIGLSGLHPDGSTYYVRLKPRYVISSNGTFIRQTRAWPQTARKDEIILCKSQEPS